MFEMSLKMKTVLSSSAVDGAVFAQTVRSTGLRRLLKILELLKNTFINYVETSQHCFLKPFLKLLPLERHLMTIKTLESVSSTRLTGEVMFSVGIS